MNFPSLALREVAQGVWPNPQYSRTHFELKRQSRPNRSGGEGYRPVVLNDETTRDFPYKKINK